MPLYAESPYCNSKLLRKLDVNICVNISQFCVVQSLSKWGPDCYLNDFFKALIVYHSYYLPIMGRLPCWISWLFVVLNPTFDLDVITIGKRVFENSYRILILHIFQPNRHTYTKDSSYSLQISEQVVWSGGWMEVNLHINRQRKHNLDTIKMFVWCDSAVYSLYISSLYYTSSFVCTCLGYLTVQKRPWQLQILKTVLRQSEH